MRDDIKVTARRRAVIKHLFTGETVECYATTEHPDSHHGHPVWVDDKGVAYFEVGGPIPLQYNITIYGIGMSTRINIGRRIRQLRIEKGLSQSQLGDLVNVKQPHIARIEKGTAAVRLDLIAEIADALGMELTLSPVV